MTRRSWLIVIAIVVIGRVVVLGAAIRAEADLGPISASEPDTNGVRGRVSDEPVIGSLASWDSVHYVDIAKDGYSREPVNGTFPNTVFFPLYPAVIRVVHDLAGISWAFSAVLIANVSFLLASVVVAVLSAQVVSQRGTYVAVGLLAIGPGSTAFSMGYSDSLLLLFTSLSLLASSRGMGRLSALTYGLAAASRPVGILLGLPLLLMARNRGDGHRQMAMLLAGPVGLGSVLAIQFLSVGDPLAFVHGQQAWTDLRVGSGTAGASVGQSGISNLTLVIGLGSLAVFVVYASLAIVQLVRGRPREYGLFAVLGVISALVLGRLVSADRYLVGSFPLAWPVARVALVPVLMISSAALAFLGLSSYAMFRLELPP